MATQYSSQYKLELGSLYELQGNSWRHVGRVPVSIKTLSKAVEWYLN